MIGMKIFYHKKGEKNMVKREDLYGIAYYKKAVYYGSTKPDLRFRIAWNKRTIHWRRRYGRSRTVMM